MKFWRHLRNSPRVILWCCYERTAISDILAPSSSLSFWAQRNGSAKSKSISEIDQRNHGWAQRNEAFEFDSNCQAFFGVIHLSLLEYENDRFRWAPPWFRWSISLIDFDFADRFRWAQQTPMIENPAFHRQIQTSPDTSKNLRKLPKFKKTSYFERQETQWGRIYVWL